MYHKKQLFISYLFTSAVCGCVVPYCFGGDRGSGVGVCAAGTGQWVVYSQNKVVTQSMYICCWNPKSSRPCYYTTKLSVTL